MGCLTDQRTHNNAMCMHNACAIRPAGSRLCFETHRRYTETRRRQIQRRQERYQSSLGAATSMTSAGTSAASAVGGLSAAPSWGCRLSSLVRIDISVRFVPPWRMTALVSAKSKHEAISASSNLPTGRGRARMGRLSDAMPSGRGASASRRSRPRRPKRATPERERRRTRHRHALPPDRASRPGARDGRPPRPGWRWTSWSKSRTASSPSR